MTPFLILFLISPIFSAGTGSFSLSKCMWTDDHGVDYDLSSLKKSDFWKVKDASGDSGLFAMDYLFNFCSTVSQKCKNTYVGALEALEVLGQLTETCEVLGKNDSGNEIIINHINSNSPDLGLKMTYSGGDTCTGSENVSENGFPRKINFVIDCADSQDSNFIQTKINSNTVTKCNMEFTIRSPAGCRVGHGSSSYKSSTMTLLYILIIFGVYLGAGIFYNKKYNGKEGINAIPNLEFWKEVPNYMKEGSKFSWEKFKATLEYSKNKLAQKSQGGVQGSTSGYSVV